MSVLRFILFSFFTHTQIYSPRFTRLFSLFLCLFLSYKLTSQGKLKQISWSRVRARVFSLSPKIQNLSTQHDCAHAATRAQLTLIVFYIDVAVSFSLLVTQMAVAVGALAKNYNHNQKKISFCLKKLFHGLRFLRHSFVRLREIWENSDALAPPSVKSFKTCYIFVLFVYTQFFLIIIIT